MIAGGEVWVEGDFGPAFARDGVALAAGAVTEALAGIKGALEGLPMERAGVRVFGIAALRPWLAVDGAVGRVAAGVLGAGCRAVRAVLFDKTAEMNWRLGWHQDRTICLERRLDVPGFGPWSVKSGLLHVAPPFDVLAGMVTVRVHLDDVPKENGPLAVAPGSHRLGRVAEGSIGVAVRKCGVRVCLARAGDVWVYSTPILHMSEAAVMPRRRRVLQVDFSAQELPGGLRWSGV